jgi:uncharacterized membrane protein
MKNSKIFYGLAALLTAIPLIYLASVWQLIPDRVPTHYNIAGEADKWGSKESLFILFGFFSVCMMGLPYIIRIFPKRQNMETNMPRMRMVFLAIIAFMSYVEFELIVSAIKGHTAFKTNFILVGVSLLLAVIGNYSQNLKYNYVIGIRTPWTLDNEEVWRRTHNLIGKWLFYGGVALAVLLLFLPTEAAFNLFIASMVVFMISTMVVSYRIHRAVMKES